MTTNLPAGRESANESVRIGRTITSVYRRWRHQVVQSLEDLDVTDATRMPLIVLYDQGRPMQQKEIAAAMAVDTSSLVRTLKILAERGLVVCAADETDRRAKAIALTDEGRDLATRIVARSMAIEASAFSIFTQDERSMLRDALERLSDHLGKQTL